MSTSIVAPPPVVAELQTIFETLPDDDLLALLRGSRRRGRPGKLAKIGKPSDPDAGWVVKRNTQGNFSGGDTRRTSCAIRSTKSQ